MGKDRLKDKFAAYKKAVNKLKEALEEDVSNPLLYDGVIQRFEFTYELAWKLMKLCLESEGIVNVIRHVYRYNSDIDLAVYCEGELPPELLLDLDEVIGIYKIDIIDMSGPLDEKLRQKIELQGVEVYCRS